MRAFARGLDAKQARKWLGHHSPSFALDTYVHPLADEPPAPLGLGPWSWSHESISARLST